MKKKRNAQPKMDQLDRIGIILGIIAIIAAAIIGTIGQAKAEAADPRYPFLEQKVTVTHSARRHVERAHVVDANGSDTQIIGGRPAGCPHRYCGCGLAKYLGIKDTRLNLAWNWAKLFPRTHTAPGMAAVRHGHVMLLVSHVSGNDWIVRDYNSGRGLSRIHERNVRGYVFVDPSARHMAMVR